MSFSMTIPPSIPRRLPDSFRQNISNISLTNNMEFQTEVLNAIADYDREVMIDRFENDCAEEDAYGQFLNQWEMNGLFDDIYGG